MEVLDKQLVDSKFCNLENRLNISEASEPEVDSRVKAPERSFVLSNVYAGYKHWKEWNRTSWTGTVSKYLKIPEDGTTAPSYMTAVQWAAVDFTSEPVNGDPRMVNDLIDLTKISQRNYYTRDDGIRNGHLDWIPDASVIDGWHVCDGNDGTTSIDGACLYGKSSVNTSALYSFGTVGAESVDHDHGVTLNVDPPPGLGWDAGTGTYQPNGITATETTATVSPGVVGTYIQRKRGYVQPS